MNKLSFIQSVLLTIVVAVVLRFFILQPFIVDGSSMEPNFHNQQYIMIDKLTYRFRSPARGEVVVFHPPVNETDNYIKRIIGLPGETVRIENGEVYVDGHKLIEPYLGKSQHLTQSFNSVKPLTLKANEYFVMGDNRSHSSDSRDWGALSFDKIEGRTWFVLFPATDFHTIETPTYVF